MATHNSKVVEGTSWIMALTIKDDGTGDPVDLTSVAFSLYISQTKDQATPDLTLTEGGGGIAVVSPSDGQLRISEVISLSPGYYHYELVGVSGGETRVYLLGVLKVLEAVPK